MCLCMCVVCVIPTASQCPSLLRDLLNTQELENAFGPVAVCAVYIYMYMSIMVCVYIQYILVHMYVLVLHFLP